MKKILKTAKAIFLIIFLQVLVVALCDIPLVFYGPLHNLRDMIVTTAMTTLHHQYLATTFLSNAEIKKIMENNKVDDADKESDAGAIVIKSNTEKNNEKDVEVIDVSKDKYKAYLMVVKDPNRVVIGSASKLGSSGMKLDQIVARYNAVGGINAGGFSDDNGKGNGGTPTGFLIENGQMIYGSKTGRYCVIGFNQESKLLLGYYNLQEVEDKGYRDAATFGPILIINGEPTIKNGNGGGGLQPRTVIGQRTDGTVLLLIIDGRQLSSAGATLKEAQDIMLENGAYNAANLDGGASTQMEYGGETVNNPCSAYGPRSLPCAFIVKQN